MYVLARDVPKLLYARAPNFREVWHMFCTVRNALHLPTSPPTVNVWLAYGYARIGTKTPETEITYPPPRISEHVGERRPPATGHLWK